MSVRKWLFPLALAGLATASVALAAPQLGRPAAVDATRQATLTPQEEAAVQQLQGLWKEARIARLELRLAELKGAPEGEVAAKQKAVEEARDRMRQWRADHPELAQQWRQGLRGGRGLRHREGMGMQSEGTTGGRGLGMQHRRGMGGGGQGMRGGRGMRGMMGGRGGQRMRLRQRDPSQCPLVQSAPAPQPDQPQQETQPEE